MNQNAAPTAARPASHSGESQASGHHANPPSTAHKQGFSRAMQRSGAQRAQPAAVHPTDFAAPFADLHPPALLAAPSAPDERVRETCPRGQALDGATPACVVANGSALASPPDANRQNGSVDARARAEGGWHGPSMHPPAGLPSLFDRLVKLIDISPNHGDRSWRLSIRLNDSVLSGTLLCIDSAPGRTELRFTPGSPQAARELASVADAWSQRLSARAGRPVAVRVMEDAAHGSGSVSAGAPPVFGGVA